MFNVYIKDDGKSLKLVMYFKYNGDIDTLIKVNNANKKPPILVIESDWSTLHNKPISLDLNVAAIVDVFEKKDNMVHIEANLLTTIAGQTIKELSDSIYIIGFIECAKENKYYIENIHIKAMNRSIKNMIMRIFCILFNHHKCNQVGFIDNTPFGYCKRCHIRCIKNEKGKWVTDEGREHYD